MADTERTQTDLLTNLFPDGQAASSITAQDLRDLIVSLSPPFGRCSMQGNTTATTISVAGTFTKILGTTTISGSERGFDDDTGTSNRLRYTAAPTRHLHIAASISFTAGADNKDVAFKLYHYDDSAASGSYLDSSLITRRVGTGSDIGAVALHADLTVDANDYIEVHVTNETDTTALTVVDFYFFGLGVVM